MQLNTINIFKIMASVTMFFLFLWFIYAASEPLLWISAAFLIALLLNPLVGKIQKYMPRKSRLGAILVTVLLILAICIFAFLVILTPLRKEFGDLGGTISTKLNELSDNSSVSELVKQGEQLPDTYKDTITTIVGLLGNFALSVISFAWAFITITMLAIFMLINPKKMVDTVISYVPKKHQKLFEKLSDALSNIVPKYFGGLLIVAVIVAIATFIPLVLLGIPYPLALATSMLFFDLIPYIGATLGYMFIIGFCLLIGETTAAVILLVYICIYQVIENNVIVPLVQQKSVSISPLSVLVAILIGSAVFGMIGALLAIPAAAMLKITYDTLVQYGYLKTSK